MTETISHQDRGPRRGSALRRIGFLLLNLALLGSAVSCSRDEVTGPGDPSEGLSIVPETGAPGTFVEIRGVDPATIDPSSMQVRIGDRPAPVIVTGSGKVMTVVPPFLDEAGAIFVPPDAVDVELIEDDQTVGRAEGALTVLALPASDGATSDTVEEMVEIAASLCQILETLAEEPGSEQQYLVAVATGLETLTSGSEPQSLSSALESLGEVTGADRALLDGMLAASGISAQAKTLNEMLLEISTGLRVPAPEVAPLGGSSGTLLSDVSLARRMQFHAIVKLFGETVIGPTNQTFAESVALVCGAIGIVQSVPAVSIVSAVLAVIDFVVNKVVVGLLPATIDDFNLEVPLDHIEPGEQTDAVVRIVASNDPPPIGIQDFVGLTLNLLGVGASPSVESFKQILEQTALFYLATVQQALAGYANAHPELNLDVELVSMPDLTWEAVIHDERLATRETLTPQIITGLPNEMNWVASESTLGEGRIYSRVSNGPDALLLSLPPGIEYNFGAFGEEIVATPTVSVFVQSDFVLEVDFPETIAPEGINVLEARAGYLGADNDPVWTPGIQVQLFVEGGSATPSSGVTDSDGQFISSIEIASGQTEVLISVQASDTKGNQLVQTVQATAEATMVILRERHAELYVYVDSAVRASETGPWTYPYSYENQVDWEDLDAGDFDDSIEEMDSISSPMNAASSAIASQSSSWSGTVGAFTGCSFEGSVELDISLSNPPDAFDWEVLATADSDYEIDFEVIGGPVEFTLTGQLGAASRLVFRGGGVSFCQIGPDPCSGNSLVSESLQSGASLGGVNESGTLGPGTYCLNVDVEGGIYFQGNSDDVPSQGTDSFDDTATVTLTLTY